jgi:hypothetical protein
MKPMQWGGIVVIAITWIVAFVSAFWYAPGFSDLSILEGAIGAISLSIVGLGMVYLFGEEKKSEEE